MHGGMITSGRWWTRSVVGVYWISCISSFWKTTAPDAAPLSLPTDASGLIALGPNGDSVTTAPVQPVNGLLSVTEWDARTASAVRRQTYPLAQQWSHCAVSPDGRTVAVDVEARRAFVLVTRPDVAPMPRAVK